VTIAPTQTGPHPAGPGAAPPLPRPATPRIALLGNPNTGKTTLFNRLSGLRHKTSNFPGTTLEARVGRINLSASALAPQPTCCGGEACACSPPPPRLSASSSHPADLIDLPGIYSLELDQTEAAICREVLEGRGAPRGQPVAEPSALCVVADATNLPRNLMLVGEALRRRLPTVVAINMIDLSRRRGIHIEAGTLENELGCAVICVSARTGEGLGALAAALDSPRISHQTPPGTPEGLRAWADDLYSKAAAGAPELDADTLTDRIDRVFTHPVGGLVVFALIMAGLFWTIFSLAKAPMDWINAAFGALSDGTSAILPSGVLSELVSRGVITGVGAAVTFLPQIALLFFLIALLEDTGYLARAAFVVDRALRPLGLAGHAFVPLLSSHACALPGIMATRGIPDRRERLATILVAPFMSCSARLPVYALVTTVLFRDSPAKAALAFVACYALGIVAGAGSALLARRTILRGKSRPMALELPTYKRPSLRTAMLTTWDRSVVFIKKAGTNIMAISVILWWLGAYPRVAPPPEAGAMRAQAAALVAAGPNADAKARAEALNKEADRLTASHEKAHSFAGRMGRAIQPMFAPLGYDWKLTVGVLTSFAARETFVSTMAVVVAGEQDKEKAGVLDTIAAAKRDDGSALFAPAVCWSLLVYYVLAMQCLPTLAVTAKEAGGVRWAVLQLLWMSGVAYVAAMIVYQFMK
jgi:ferrous iron transport protein B